MTLPQINSKTGASGDYRLVTTAEELEAVRLELEAADLIAVDTETEGLEYEAVIVGVCLSTKPGTGYYIPIRHEMYPGVLYENQLPSVQVFDAIRFALETRPCVGHNTKFDKQALWKDDVDCNFVHDTLAIAKLFGTWKNNGLKFLVKLEFGHEMAELDSLFKRVGNKKPDIRPAVLSPEEICNYAAEDSNWTLQLCLKYLARIPNLVKNRLYQLEMKLLPVVAEMEAFGLPVSRTFLEEQGKICAAHEKRLEKEIVQDVRELLQDPEYTCNFGSPKQLATLLYEHLKLPVQINAKSGNPSTDKDALAELAKQNPVAARIQTLRTMGKLNGTYLTGLLSKVHPDGRIRGGFNQFGTDTGRFSSSKPNLQNLPRTQTFYLWPADDQSLAEEFIDPKYFRRTPDGLYEFWDASKEKWKDKADEIVGYVNEDGKEKTKMAVASDGKTYGIENGVFKEVWRCPTRDFVAASPGHYIIEADFSQIELRIMAGESGEPTLVNAYLNGDDVHTATAATVHSIRPEDVTDNQRQSGKTLNFSLLYGAGADGTAKLLSISKAEAQDLIDKYFATMTEVGDWMASVKAAAGACGYATTNLGRVRRFPEIGPGHEKWIRAKQEREAVNFKIQGAAADVMKLALVRLSTRLREYFGDEAKIVSTVHDSAMLEVSEHIDIYDLMAVVFESMENGINQADFTRAWPDLKVDVKKGPSWAAAKEVKRPDTLTLPPMFEGDLPKVRVRKVALEREYGISDSPTANKTEQVDIFTGLVTVRSDEEEQTAAKDTSWVIELPKALTPAQYTGLIEFLSARSAKVTPDARQYGTVRVLMPNEDGSIREQDISGRFVLTMEDHMALRIKVGNCTLRQELDDIDPNEVMRGIDFGL